MNLWYLYYYSLLNYNRFVYNSNRSNSISMSVSLYNKYSKLYDYRSDYI
jgi:hypothetical protein